MMPETEQLARQPEAGPVDRPGVFILSCFKCTRSYELHGRESILSTLLLDEGWVVTPKGMICPWCPAASEPLQRNRSRELAARARRYGYPVIQVAA